jgi:hypothetical protein
MRRDRSQKRENSGQVEATSRVHVGPVVVVSGDAGVRRQWHSDHGRLADHADRALPQLSRRAMGGQCLSGRLRGLHCARRPRGGSVWRTAASMVGLALFGAASRIIATAGIQTELLGGATDCAPTRISHFLAPFARRSFECLSLRGGQKLHDIGRSNCATTP